MKLKHDDGFMAAEWVAVTALILVPVFVVSISFLQYPSRKNFTQVASAAAARAYVQTLNQSQADVAARAAVAEVIAGETNEVVPTSDSDVVNFLNAHDVSVSSSKPDGYCPGSEISVRVTAKMPISVNPFNNSTFGNGLTLSTNSTERIDDFAEIDDTDLSADINNPLVCTNA